MPTTTPRSPKPASRIDPAPLRSLAQLRAIVELQRLGWTPLEIQAALDISLSTWYRRLDEIRRREHRPLDVYA